MSEVAVVEAETMGAGLMDRLLIREILENWVIWRDAGDWGRLETLWHEDGAMVSTWCQAHHREFITNARKLMEAGTTALHLLGGTSVDINGTRAAARTKMRIFGQGLLDGVPVRVTCVGRFFDALEKRNGRWGIVLREPAYDLDWLSPFDPSVKLELDAERLSWFPVGYRHMGYLQSLNGLEVNRNLPSTRGPAMDALRERMSNWLNGAPASCLTS